MAKHRGESQCVNSLLSSGHFPLGTSSKSGSGFPAGEVQKGIGGPHGQGRTHVPTLLGTNVSGSKPLVTNGRCLLCLFHAGHCSYRGILGQGWRGGSVLKSTSCSAKGILATQGSSQPSVIPVPGVPTLSLASLGMTHMWHTDIHAGKHSNT